MAYRRSNRGRGSRRGSRRSVRTSRSTGGRRMARSSRGRSGTQTVRIVLEAPGSQSLPGSVQQIAAARKFAGVSPQQARPVAGKPSTARM